MLLCNLPQELLALIAGQLVEDEGALVAVSYRYTCSTCHPPHPQIVLWSMIDAI